MYLPQNTPSATEVAEKNLLTRLDGFITGVIRREFLDATGKEPVSAGSGRAGEMYTIRPPELPAHRLAGAHKRKTLGAHRLAPVRRHEATWDTASSPTRWRAQTWCSLFIAPCASLFFASRTCE